MVLAWIGLAAGDNIDLATLMDGDDDDTMKVIAVVVACRPSP